MLGAVGILLSAAHYATGDTAVSLVPFVGVGTEHRTACAVRLVFAVAGFVLMLLGGLLARRVARDASRRNDAAQRTWLAM